MHTMHTFYFFFYNPLYSKGFHGVEGMHQVMHTARIPMHTLGVFSNTGKKTGLFSPVLEILVSDAGGNRVAHPRLLTRAAHRLGAMKKRTPIVVILAACLLLTAGCGPAKQEAPADKGGAAASQASKPAVSAAGLKTVTDFETGIRTWGLDPDTDLKGLARKDAKDAIAALRMQRIGANPAAGLMSFTPDAKTGPEAPNPSCPFYEEIREQTGSDINGWQVYCKSGLKAGDWLMGQEWGMGAKWASGPTAVPSGDKVRVTGTVRAILVQGNTRGRDDRVASWGWYAVTPAVKEWKVDDLLSIRDGKVSGIEHRTDDPWWTDPWLTEWTKDIASGFDGATRTAIPVKGMPSFDGQGYPDVDALYEPESEGEDGTDWSMWSDLPGQGPSDEDNKQLMDICIAKYGDQCPLLSPGQQP